MRHHRTPAPPSPFSRAPENLRAARGNIEVTLRARTMNAILERVRQCEVVRKADLRRGDELLVRTENSVYSIRVLNEATYKIRGGWFDRCGLSPVTTSIAGCTWGGSVIKRDIVAACGLHLEFGNRVVTSPIRQVQVIRDEARESRGLRPADLRDLLHACYGARPDVTSAG